MKSIRLIAAASSFAHRIGPPSDGPAFGVRFTRRVKLDGGFVVIEHHPRASYQFAT